MNNTDATEKHASNGFFHSLPALKALSWHRLLHMVLVLGLVMSWSNFQADASSPEEEQAESEGVEKYSSLQDGDWPLAYTLSQAEHWINSVAYSPDGEYIAYASSDNNVYIH